MFNFIFHNPVKIIFGKNQICVLSQEIPKQSRVLLTYGRGSIKRNGVYEQVRSALAGYDVFEFPNIEPNPSYETLMPAMKIIKENKIDFLLAVGGGSVIDGTKFIAAAAHFTGDPWDILVKQVALKSALPFGTVLTLPATGSEMNSGTVISKKSTKDKLGFLSPLLYPKFSILDPTATFSLPIRQTANGIVDIFVHVLEQYLTYSVDAPLQDRLAESILLTLIEEAPKVLKNSNDYAARANIMWCGTLALNDLIGAGVPQDWAAHWLGHEITACFNLDHGQTLAVLMPSVLEIQRIQKRNKLLQYAARIWGIEEGDVDTRIDAVVAKTRDFFQGLGMKLYLHDYGIDASAIPILLDQLRRHGFIMLGEHSDLDLEACAKVYQASL